MRPILWGLLVSVIGALGWVTFVIFSVLTLGEFRLLANISGYIMIAGLPIGLIGELLFRRRKPRR